MKFTEYVSYHPPQGYRDELIHGEIILSPSGKNKHQELCQNLEYLLRNVLRAKGDPKKWVIQRDTTLYINGFEGPRPDVFVIQRSRWEAGKISLFGYSEGVPELVLEVWSDSNTAKEMETKREIYFSDGHCLEVWEVKEKSAVITVYPRILWREQGVGIDYGIETSIPLPVSLAKGEIAAQEVWGSTL